MYSFATRINEAFEMFRVVHVPCITIRSFPYPLQSSLSWTLPAAYAQILPVFCEKCISSKGAPAKRVAFQKCPDTWE